MIKYQLICALFATLMVGGRVTAQQTSLQVNAGGSISILPEGSLRVTGNIVNLGTGENFVVESDANLVQVNDAAVNTGNIHVRRNVNLTRSRLQYNYFGTPVAFQTGESYKTIYPGVTYVLYYNQTNNYFYNSSGVNIPGRGLALKEPYAPPGSEEVQTTAVYKGVPQNGAVTLTIENKNTAVADFGYNLVGNPYASNIDLRKLYEANGGKISSPQVISPNIEPTFLFWDNNMNTQFQQQGSNYNGQAYAYYNVLAGPDGTGLGSHSGLNTKVPTNIVKVGQGFMVRALKTSYPFVFANSVRTAEHSDVDFLGRNASQPVDRYWMELKTPGGIRNTMAVVYYDGGNNAFGPEDSRNMGGSDAFFTMVDDKDISINGRQLFAKDDVLPVGAHHFVNGNYTISLAQTEGIFSGGQAVYLRDKQQNVVTNLSQGPYTFAASAGVNTGRFEILYRPEAVLDTGTATVEPFSVYRAGSDFIMRAPQRMTSLEVYDAAGKLVRRQAANSVELHLPADGLLSGIYFLKVRTESGGHYTKKILK